MKVDYGDPSSVMKAFKSEVKRFLGDLSDKFPEQGDLVALRVFLVDQLPLHEFIEAFVKHVLPLESWIREKNEEFFLGNRALFGTLPQDSVGNIKSLWISGRLTPEDKDDIWSYFLLFLKLGKLYAHLVMN